ncbi:MAG: DUF2750 domain-containing protein [Chitinophagales bacterium]|nr:DUF2750 domain-containing protein [Chitinophagales bacterium]
MHEDKIGNLLGLNDEDRYSYSIREFVKLEKIWVVSSIESLITIVDEDGDEILPIWPHKEVAILCLPEEFKVEGFSVDYMEYEKFKEMCIPDMTSSNVLFGVFFNKSRAGIAVNGEDLLKDLEVEEDF